MHIDKNLNATLGNTFYSRYFRLKCVNELRIPNNIKNTNHATFDLFQYPLWDKDSHSKEILRLGILERLRRL